MKRVFAILMMAANAYGQTDDRQEGRFDFGLIDPGKYRFLPSPNRGFKQPANLNCFESPECELKLTLEVNPTDQEFAGCLIQ